MSNIVQYSDFTKNIDPWKLEIDSQDLPPGFEMDEEGTWYTPSPQKKDDNPKPFKVCDAIVIVARVRNENELGWGRILKFKTPEQKIRVCFIKDTLLFESAPKIAQELVDNGFHAETEKVAYLKKLLNGIESKIHTYAKQSGWTKNPQDKEVFVLPSGEIVGGNGVIMRPDCMQKLCQPSGSREDWQEHVGKYAVGNNRLILSMCVPLAATLLYDTQTNSGGFHVYGGSQTGKTAQTKAAASVQGRPVQVPEGVFGSWSNTANAMEGVTARANDCGLYLDEMSQAPANDVAKIIYSIGNGSGKGRMRADSSMRDVYKWRTMLLSTGEERAEDKQLEAGKKTNAGVQMRLADIPSDAGKGHGVYDNLHGFASNRAFSRHLVAMADKFYGHALRDFVTQYCEMRNKDKAGVIQQLKDQCENWCAANIPSDASHQVISVGGKFALVAVAGEMAIAMQVLPWPAGEASRGVAECLRIWIEDRGDLGMSEDVRIIVDLKAFLLGHQHSHFTDSLVEPDTRYSQEIYGIRRSVDDHYDYFIFKDHLAKILPGINVKYALKVLLRAGYLIRETGRETNIWRFREPANKRGITPTYRISGRIFEYGIDD